MRLVEYYSVVWVSSSDHIETQILREQSFPVMCFSPGRIEVFALDSLRRLSGYDLFFRMHETKKHAYKMDIVL